MKIYFLKTEDFAVLLKCDQRRWKTVVCPLKPKVAKEVRNLAAKIRTFRQGPPTTINLEEPLRPLRVTLEEPDYDNAPDDFGSFALMEEFLSFVPTYDYFVVRTPQSSGSSEEAEELRASAVHPDQLLSRLDDLRDEHTVRAEDITLPEEPIPVVESDFQNIRDGVAEGEDFPEIPIELQQIIDRDVREREPEPVPEPEILPESGRDITQRDEIADEQPPQAEIELPAVDEQPEPPIAEPEPPVAEPEAPVAEQEVPVAEQEAPGGPAEDQRPRQRDQIASPSSSSGEHDRRSAQRASEASERSFILPPAPPRVRGRRRRRHLIIDRRTQLSADAIIRSLRTNTMISDDTLLRPLSHANKLETAEAMLSRFGLKEAAHGSKRLWPKYRTLPEPNDPAKFGCFAEELMDVVPDVLADDSLIPDVTMGELRDETRGESREEQRAEDTREESREVSLGDLSGAATRPSFFSRTLQDSREQMSTTIASRMSFLPAAPDMSGSILDLPRTGADFGDFDDQQEEPLLTEPIAELRMSPTLPEGEVIEPRRVPEQPTEQRGTPEQPTEAEAEAEQAEPAREPCERLISPVRTPPPPSPSPPRNPLPFLAEVMRHIEEAISESLEPDATCFTSVLRRTPSTRMYVTRMFTVLLDLHKMEVIHAEQTMPGCDIFIIKGPGFDRFYENVTASDDAASD